MLTGYAWKYKDLPAKSFSTWAFAHNILTKTLPAEYDLKEQRRSYIGIRAPFLNEMSKSDKKN